MKKRKPSPFYLLLLLSLILFLAALYVYLIPTINQIAQDAQAASEVAAFHELRQAAPDPDREAAPQDHTSGSIPTSESITMAVTTGSPEPKYAGLREAMQAYNEQIYEDRQAGLSDPWCYTATVIDLASYGLDGEAVGVLTIPAMDYEEPIYLGATDDHLNRGAAQLSISSMPIGGVNTNCVLAGHRGWSGALHFRHIELLKVGDVVRVTNLWETLTYTVSEIKIVEPWQTEALLIQEGRDLITLLTCHPYGSGGRYRYVVYCERNP